MNKTWLRRLFLSFLPGELKVCYYCGKQLSKEDSNKGRNWCCYKHKDLLALRKRNKEIKRVNDRKYKNSIKGKESTKRFNQSIKGKRQISINSFIRTARKNNIIHAFTNREWEDLLKSTEGICPKCKNHVGIKNLTLDHIIPISLARRNQIYRITDIQPLCMTSSQNKSS